MYWQQTPKITPRVRKKLSKYSDVEAQLLFSYGIKTPRDAKTYFGADLKSLPPFELMPGIKTAAKRILTAVKNQEQIFIYGDYDVDGVSATAILFDLLFRHLGQKYFRIFQTGLPKDMAWALRVLTTFLLKRAGWSSQLIAE